MKLLKTSDTSDTLKKMSINNLTTKTSSQRISEKFKFNAVCVEFNLNGLFPPELTVFFLLIKNIERLKQILLDNYEYGAASIT